MQKTEQESLQKETAQLETAQLETMQKLINLNQSITSVDNTLIVYEAYNDPKGPELTHLHVFASKLLDQNLNILANNKKVGKRIITTYQLDPASSSTIKKKFINLDELNIQHSHDNQHIGIYEMGLSRVVALPIPRRIIDHEKGKKFQASLDEQAKSRHEQSKKDKKNMKTAQQEWNKQKQQKIRQYAKEEQDRFIRLLKLEQLVSNLISKSKNVAIAGLIECESERLRTYKEFELQYTSLFQLSQTHPQFVVYSADRGNDGYEGKSLQYFDNKHVTSLFVMNAQNEVERQKKKSVVYAINQKDKRPFRPQFLKKAKEDNAAMAQVANELAQSWRRISNSPASCFVQILNDINKGLKQPPIKIQYASFKTVENRYGLAKRQFPTRQLGSYFSPQMRKKRNLGDREEVPSEIKQLVLAHEFDILVGQFLGKYHEMEHSHDRDYQKILKEWKQLFKTVHELTLVHLGPTSRVQVQNNYDFLCFLMDASLILEQSSGTRIALSGAFKVLLEKVRAKHGRVIQHLIAENTQVHKGKSLEYYNFYLMLIQENKQHDRLKETRYKEFDVREQRAFTIAQNYIYDELKIIDAAKDYATIILQYNNFPSQKKQSICISDLEKKLAKLLAILGLEHISAEIYLKSRFVGLANKAFSFACKKSFGNNRATMLIEWGQKMQREIEYELAMQCYRDAYDCAKSPEISKSAVSHKKACRERIRRGEPEEVQRAFSTYLDSQTNDIQEFASKVSIQPILKNIISSLSWQIETESAVLGSSCSSKGTENGLTANSNGSIAAQAESPQKK